jgi:hypothetical protein
LPTLLTLGAVAPPARAQSRITVPVGCGSDAEFVSELERLTGAPAALAEPASVSIEPHAQGGFELRLALAGEQRTLRDPDCRVLWRSALVIVAAASRAPSEPPAPAPAAPAAPAPAPAPAPPAAASPPVAPPAPVATPSAEAQVRAFELPAAARTPSARASRGAVPRASGPVRARRARRVPSAPEPAPASSAPEPVAAERTSPATGSAGVRWGVAAAVGVSGGIVPGLGPSFELGTQLEVLPWATALALRYWPERSEVIGERGVDVSAFGGRAAALFRVAPAVNVLAGLEVTRLVGTGAPGVSARNADAAWQLAPTLGVNLITWDIQYLRIELGVAGRVSLLRPQFVVTGFGELYRAPAFGGDAIIRGVWLFR